MHTDTVRVHSSSSSQECTVHAPRTHIHTYIYRHTYGHVRAASCARADLEEAKGEEREDVDSPPSDRDRVRVRVRVRVARRDAASCCRSTVSGSLKVSSYRRWTGSLERTVREKRSLCFVSFLLVVVVVVVVIVVVSPPRRRALASTIMQLKKAMLKIFDQCKSSPEALSHALIIIISLRRS